MGETYRFGFACGRGDGREGCCQIGAWLDGVEFADLNQERIGCQVWGTGIVAGEESVLSAQCDGLDCSLDRGGVHLNQTVGKEEAKASPVFCDVFQRLTQGCFLQIRGRSGG